MKLFAHTPGSRVASTCRYATKPLFNETELKFAATLDQLTSGRCRILAKTRLVDVIRHFDVPGLERIKEARVDFLICRQEDWLPMLGIQIDDMSHETPEGRQRDSQVNNAFIAAGLPLLRVPIWELGDVNKLAVLLGEAWANRVDSLAAPISASRTSAPTIPHGESATLPA